MKNKAIFVGAFLLALLVSVFSVSASTVTIRPDAQGANSAWMNAGCGSGSSEWQCVDEVTLNTSDNLSINTANTFETFTFSNTGLSSVTINSVTLYYHGKWYSSTRKSFQPVIRASSVNYNGTVQNWTVNFTTLSQTYTTNPATGSAWTISEVEALEAGIKSAALTYGGRIAQVYAVVDYTINNSCNNSDGGIAIKIFGNTNGYYGGTPYTNNDVCIDNSSITEYFCSGDFSNSTVLSCGTDGYSGSNFCSGGDVYRSYVDYACGTGACFNTTNNILQDDCVAGIETCTFGACVFANTCFDYDYGLNVTIPSNVAGILNGTNYTNYDVCLNSTVLAEYTCVGGSLGQEPYAVNVVCNTSCSLGACI